MSTVTFLKNDGIFIYADYLRGRAALRIRELDSINPAQVIRRDRAGDPVAVLVSKAWYDARIAAYDAVDAATFSDLKETKDDDFMGSNLSLMIDLVRGNAQTTDLQRKINATGLTNADFKTWSIIDLKEFFRDNSDAVPFEPTVQVGGEVLALLLHTGHHAALAATPTTTTYSGTGNGTLDVVKLHPGGAVTETITATATSATSFTIAGTVSGTIGTLTVGTVFESPQIRLLITAGGTPFVATDEFTIASVAADLS